MYDKFTTVAPLAESESVDEADFVSSLGKNHALKKYDQFALYTTSCFLESIR